MWSGLETSELRSIVVHNEAVESVGVMIHEVSNDFESGDFGDLVIVQCLFERREEVEDCDRFSPDDTAAFHLVLDSSRPPHVVPCDVRVGA